MSGRRAEKLIGEVAALGRVQQSLESLTDRQVGQLMFNHVWEALPMASSAMSISIEATHRLFRSQAGARGEHELLNNPENLPDCPQCKRPMLHYVGIGEADYRYCEACRYKIEEQQ
jgi:formate dehydrogenase maturation protein FdhE